MEEAFVIQTDSFQITQFEFFIRLLISAGIGFVIGLEREHAALNEKGENFAGVRTFSLVVILGFLAAFVSEIYTPWIIFAGFLATLSMVTVSYWISARKGEIGGTTEFATLLAYLLGVTTFSGFIQESLGIMVILVVLLSLKVKLKRIIGQITPSELYAFIKFVVIALLIFPFLPNETYGPYAVFNPRELGWVIVLTSGLGFAGYLLMKFLGSDRGILFTGILGGLVSSTVVTWVFSKKSKEVPALSKNCAIAILSASTIMVVRVVVWVSIFNRELLSGLLLPMALIFITGIGISIYFYKKQETQAKVKTEFPLGEALNLKEALFFGILYTGILFLVSYANQQFGTKGIFISSAIASLTDIDAITISVSKLAGESLSISIAQNAILLATLCNTLVKIGIALWTGSKLLRKYILIGYGLIFVAGLLGFVILNY
ncbi:MgtC/SapB family protein [Putridiphycobacter roseus]|uniref:MgtC/SapB family protein n=2 Tax=Putridiphycobacter roseus TaxID=2219161 RepID=A0A2W1NDE2_9FLAO|nr:MgtC/SapB family protein [Putridiphycobacter roseus]